MIKINLLRQVREGVLADVTFELRSGGQDVNVWGKEVQGKRSENVIFKLCQHAIGL